MNSSTVVVGGWGYIGKHLQRLYPEYCYPTREDFDLNNKSQIDKYFLGKNIDLCIILASKISFKRDINTLEEPFQTNVHGLNNLLQVFQDHNQRPNLVYFSSMTVYDVNNSFPVNESDNLFPLHSYGLSKIWAEDLIKYSQLPSLIIRLPGVYGGTRTNGFIYNTIKTMQKDMKLTINTEDLGFWESIHITDLLFLFQNILKKFHFSNTTEIMNLSYGEKIDFIDTAQFIKQQLNSNSEIDIQKSYKDLYLNNAKMKKLISPSYSYYERLKLYIEEVIS